ncbi:hypothetical protein SISNIDRAFT_463248 [Sistotremastrum niveocremeum HHB9708]|uniref:Mid2 domain-containing protein n=1 Tax=Sistotremastrum niveocremeum HHB9708 TaxID=1314777 RepID=A0A164YXH7_9AGAM|nr:hypothetical protein SISNIDRAFT_463248 [Sistotremastrum niveocremeum HHB9708]
MKGISALIAFILVAIFEQRTSVFAAITQIGCQNSFDFCISELKDDKTLCFEPQNDILPSTSQAMCLQTNPFWDVLQTFLKGSHSIAYYTILDEYLGDFTWPYSDHCVWRGLIPMVPSYRGVAILREIINTVREQQVLSRAFLLEDPQLLLMGVIPSGVTVFDPAPTLSGSQTPGSSLLSTPSIKSQGTSTSDLNNLSSTLSSSSSGGGAPAQTDSPASPPQTSPPSQSSGVRLSVGAIVGIAVGPVAGLVLLYLLVRCCGRRNNRTNFNQRARRFFLGPQPGDGAIGRQPVFTPPTDWAPTMGSLTPQPPYMAASPAPPSMNSASTWNSGNTMAGMGQGAGFLLGSNISHDHNISIRSRACRLRSPRRGWNKDRAGALYRWLLIQETVDIGQIKPDRLLLLDDS